MPLVYDQLRDIASKKLAREARAQTLQPTALVNEVYLRLVDQHVAALRDRAHFLALCARVMRQILVDHARRRNAAKRDAGERVELELDQNLLDAGGSTAERHLDVLALDEALGRLATMDERKARVVELRVFAGMEVAQVAETLEVSKRTVEGDWFFARAWLRGELGELGESS